MDFSGNDNHGKPKASYLERLAGLSLDQLKETTERMIWLSGYANNNPRSDYHWQVDACYEEIKKRTGDDKIYSDCYNRVVSSL